MNFNTISITRNSNKPIKYDLLLEKYAGICQNYWKIGITARNLLLISRKKAGIIIPGQNRITVLKTVSVSQNRTTELLSKYQVLPSLGTTV